MTTSAASRRRFVTSLALLPALGLTGLRPSLAADLKADERVVFFPSTARRRADGRWRARIEAWVHELERRPGANHLLARYLGLDLGDLSPDDRSRYEARTQLFRVDSERGRALRIRFGSDPSMLLPASDSNGRVSTDVAVGIESAGPDAARWLVYAVVLRNDDTRRFAGSVLALPEKGLSVVSDIDDTIKHTQVLDRREMLLNTFARGFTAAPGMASWMQRCALADPSIGFHYVSGGPIQLYPPLAQFVQDETFPPGSMHLRTVDVAREVFAAGTGTRTHKLAVISRLLADFPQRRFVLVGDSGEQDPEIYGELARVFRGRIAAVFIRNVTGENGAAPRYARALRDLPRATWIVFDDPGRLPSSGF